MTKTKTWDVFPICQPELFPSICWPLVRHGKVKHWVLQLQMDGMLSFLFGTELIWCQSLANPGIMYSSDLVATGWRKSVGKQIVLEFFSNIKMANCVHPVTLEGLPVFRIGKAFYHICTHFCDLVCTKRTRSCMFSRLRSSISTSDPCEVY